MVQPPDRLDTFESLLKIVEALRGPEGCPWDKEQTHRSLTPFAIEEAHELAEAIESGDREDTVGELGDLLLQVVLHAEIGRQSGEFAIQDVIRAISEKMVRRHPHVFAATTASNSEEVLANWAQIKNEEKKRKAERKGLSLDVPTRFDVSPALPALSRSHKIGDKTKRERFDWSNPTDVLAKVDEELAEVKVEMAKLRPEGADAELKAKLEHEIGDLLFSVAQLARHLGLEAEQCLRTANTRFETRFFSMKRAIVESGRNYDDLSLDELEAAWQTVKKTIENQAATTKKDRTK